MKTVVITAAENMSDATYARICRGFREKLGDDVKFEELPITALSAALSPTRTVKFTI